MPAVSAAGTSGRELVLELTRRLRERVLPELGSHAGRAHERDGAGGDVTFAVDAIAGLVPSIGSTTSTCVASGWATSPRSSE